jgi:predicted DNA-binding protein with PD1-like motif
MQYTQADQGRVFVLRLEHEEVVHEVIETFARDKGIHSAALIALGGADKGSRLIVGPEEGGASPVTPMQHRLDDVFEVSGTGTLFPDEQGRPILHMHMACGRENKTVTGCVRAGVKVWRVMEVVIFELLNATARREMDQTTGFKLLRTL